MLYSDGGGKVHAARHPFAAPRRSRDSSWELAKRRRRTWKCAVRVNGQPGLITSVDGQLTDVLTLDVVDGRIAKCFIIRNPDKLARVAIA